MKPVALRYWRDLVAALALLAITACSQATPDTDTIYLVRHAEKTTAQNDPGLTEAGKARAEALADRLESENITHIFSSDYVRTMETAAPLAERLGLQIESYDPSDLSGIAETLKATSGRILVVGHSNTTPQLTELLGGDGGTPIVEATEYDRLYVVTMGDDEPVKSYLTQYGAASK